MFKVKAGGYGKYIKAFIFALLVLTLMFHAAVTYSPMNGMGDTEHLSKQDVNNIGAFFPLNCDIVNKDNNSAVIRFRLFDMFTVRSVEADLTSSEQVYLGGDPIGISIRADGVIITGKTNVVTDNGIKTPTEDADIASGDVLIKLNGAPINSMDDIRKFLKNFNGITVIATIRRGGNVFETPIYPALDSLSKEKKLGLFIKEDIAGIGTLTYIRIDSGRFGALGHTVSESINAAPIDEVKGYIYDCVICGVEKGEKGKAGELKGNFNRTTPVGEINKSNFRGIFGCSETEFLSGRELVAIGSRLTVKAGKAQILTTVDGGEPQRYDIEIIKLNYQKTDAEKGMVIRVTDKRLLDKTGGIVQGMSGSPIIQDGRLVGAVTHVFLNDPTKGYGIYIDWMKDN